jgi:DNA polymerase
MEYVYIDFETTSTLNLKSSGPVAYANHPGTSILITAWRMNGVSGRDIGDKRAVHNYKLACSDITPLIRAAERSEAGEPVTFVAHNGEMFDELIWRRFFKPRPKWEDTLHLARLAGLSGSLESLGRLVGEEKKQSAAIKWFIANPGKLGTVRLWEDLLSYAEQDVKSLEKIHQYLINVLDPFVLQHERPIIEAHRKINQHGFRVDAKLIVEKINEWARRQVNMTAEADTITGGINLASRKQVLVWLEKAGVSIRDLRSKTIDEMLDDIEDTHPDVHRVLSMRQDFASSRFSKLDAALNEMQTGRVCPNQIEYAKAHTWRFAGRGTQPQNFPRVDEKQDPLYNLREIIIPREGYVFAKIDYSQIEARMVAWLVNQTDLIEQFRTGIDFYSDFGSYLFNRRITKQDKMERFVCKTVMLGCQYGMGKVKFAITCESLLNGKKLEDFGLSAERCIQVYRERFPAIVRGWKNFDNAMMYALRSPGQSFTANRVSFRDTGGTLELTLPSGTKRLYHGFGMQMVPPPKEWKSDTLIPKFHYMTNRGYNTALYGGLVMENVSQATCRDLHAEKLPDIIQAGYMPVLHAHDEIVTEVLRTSMVADYERIQAIMEECPHWAPDFPLATEGLLCVNFAGKKV